jgi:hypothetical protein
VVYVIKSLKEAVSSYIIKCIYYSKFQSCLKYGIIFWGESNESLSIFKLQKRVIRIISGASTNSSCRQIFKDYNILTVASLYILEVICFIKKYKESFEHNIRVHTHNTQRKLDLRVQYCNTALFRKSVVNMGIKLYNKVPDHIKMRDNFGSFKRDLKSFLLQHSVYSVDEFMAF